MSSKDELDLSGVIITQKDLLEMTKEEVIEFEKRWKEMLGTPMPFDKTNQEVENDQEEGRQRS